MPKHSKRYNQLAERIDVDREYTPEEALDLLSGASDFPTRSRAACPS